MAGRSVANRSQTITIQTPRGPVEIERQRLALAPREQRLAMGVWLARRHGQRDWKQAPTAREAIRRATLTAPRQQPGWLLDAAAQAIKEARDVSAAARPPCQREASHPPARRSP